MKIEIHTHEYRLCHGLITLSSLFFIKSTKLTPVALSL